MKTCRIVAFAVPADYRVQLKENETKDMYLNHVRVLKKKLVEHESDGYTNCKYLLLVQSPKDL